MPVIRRKWLVYLGFLLIVVVFLVVRSPDAGFESNATDVGTEWAWEVSSHNLNDTHDSKVEARGTGMREGLKRYWNAMLADNSRAREYQLRWGQHIFSFWSWDHEHLPELIELRKTRLTDQKKYESAIEFLVNGQLHALLRVDEEDFDLEAETVSLIAILHLEVG